MFHSARVKLTVWYLFLIMIVSITFSAMIYSVQIHEIERIEKRQLIRIERVFEEHFFPPVPVADPEFLEETKQRLLLYLFIINVGILVMSGGLGYLLAGLTLNPIKEMMEEQNRFIGDASHEFKTPLTSLKIAFEVYKRSKQKSQVRVDKLISESIDEVNKLQKLAESLLQLVQYEKPNGNIEFKSVLFHQVVLDAVRRIGPSAKQKNISIKTNIKKVSLPGNKETLAELVGILLDNAIKYSPEKNKIEIGIQTSDGFMLLSIRDYGAGIEKENLPRIFDRFFRADNARSKEGSGGYGLGLSIAKKIIDLHKGSVTVESEVGKGTTFNIKLPTGSKGRLPII